MMMPLSLCCHRLSEILLLCMIQTFAEFLKIRQEPHLIVTVGFVHEVSERATLGNVLGDVAEDHEPQSIRHEFLHDLTCQTRLELEEILCQPFYWNKN